MTTDRHRMQPMMEALRTLRVPHSPGAPLFFFTTRDELHASDPLMHEWKDGNGRRVRLMIVSKFRIDRLRAAPKSIHHAEKRGCLLPLPNALLCEVRKVADKFVQ